MRLADLDLRFLLDIDPAEGGILRFAGQRALILDAVALGLLRAELIATVGQTAARGILTRFGFAHGWRTAQTFKGAIPWDDPREWQQGGGRIHELQGMVRTEPVVRAAGDGEAPFAESLWRDSYEAEQHLLHLGQADEPVCWTLTGFASGYLSFCNDKEIYCIEERCRGRGDPVCHLVGRPRDLWGDEILAHLPFYRKGCLEASLDQVATSLKAAERKLASRRRGIAVAADPAGLIARSAPMRRALDLARRVAPVDTTVLLTGESGVGKERLARFIHESSGRATGPFLALNCAALPEGLLESELFGHARGAFTGADTERIGLMEAARGGTLFLDEIGELGPSLQAKLLRVLQERELRRVGENQSRAIDLRCLAATNRDLAAEVAAGRFRADLYYRLRVIEIRLPPLRERPEDILPLAHALLADLGPRLRREVFGLTPDAAELLLHYPWPGNVRELQNALERALILTEEQRIGVAALPEEVRGMGSVTGLPGMPRPLEAVEREHILGTLERNGGNQAQTARELGIGTATLYRKLKRYRSARGPKAPHPPAALRPGGAARA